MNKTEVLEKIQPVVGLKAKEAVKPSVIFGDNKVFIRPSPHAQLIEVGAEGRTALLNRTKVPEGLASRLQPNTLRNVLNESISQCSLLLKDDLIVDMATPGQWREVNPTRVMDTIDKAISKVDFHRVMMMPNHVLRLETIGVEEKAVKRGDILNAGALIQFSPVGIINPIVQNFAVRLTCTNGATATDVMQEFDFGGNGDENFWQWLRVSVKEAYKSLGNVVERYKLMQGERIPADHRASILTSLLKGSGIRGKDAETVQAEALRLPPETTYDMMNLITWATSHVVSNPQIIARGQMAANDFSRETAHRRMCPACRRILS